MKSSILKVSVPLASVVLLFFFHDALGWGFWAHKEIHRYAIQSLPEGMKKFFEENSEAIIARSVEPDQRRYKDPQEGFYHYIDIDRYGLYPFSDLPRSYDEAVKKYGRSTVDSNGTVPWRIANFTAKLTQAFKHKNRNDIIFYASNLGHYVADSNVPLHATENYDGQLSGQKGIHSRWESALPERFGAAYRLAVRDVEYISDPLQHAFSAILRSFSLVDSLLAADNDVRKALPESELVKVVQKRGKTEIEYSDAYFDRYHRRLNGMVERRMEDAIRDVASFWYTAWVNAGKPELNL